MRLLLIALTSVLCCGIAPAQDPQKDPFTRQDDPANLRLPSGKLQRDEIVKSDHKKNLKDADELMKLSEEVKIELEKSDGLVLSLGTLRKVEEIEKVAKRLRGRLKP
ncbi:MAG TPA: hypothetical protein VE621_04550 [Bryobacteraceae bacterium]|jgi:hypothetical protein|nr:hypothetical protein [Bryobacteraceae bacterium]